MCGGVRTGSQLNDEKTSEGKAFDEFVAREFNQVVALALAVLRDGDEALEVAQETMARAFSAWSEVGVMDRPGGWARRVALNLVTDVLRRRPRRKKLHLRLVGEHKASSNSSEVEDWDTEFWGEVAALPRRQRDVTVLFYVHDLSVADIALIVDVPEGTVKSDLSRSRETLRDKLSRSER